MDLRKVYATDLKAEEKGAWGTTPSSFKVKVRAWTSAAMDETIRDKTREYQERLNLDTLPEEEDRKLLVDVLVETGIVDWDKDTQLDGKPCLYSKENARTLLEDPEMKYLVNDIRMLCQQRATFNKDRLQKAAKN